jgi:transcriptional regulator with XRE-family HTH domain
MIMMDGRQIAMARAALGWSREELAEKSGVSAPTIKRAETTGTGMYVDTAVKLQKAFEAAGLVLLGNGHVSMDGGPGVRFRDQK